jgi:predicted RNA binding protein YcfA (HicA-like mRNA interferase family)
MSFHSRKVLRAPFKRGFYVLREGANHTIVRRDEDGVQIVVPRHRNLKRGTVRGMAIDANADWEQFRREVS